MLAGNVQVAMDADSTHRLKNLETFLISTLKDYVERHLPLRRIVLASSLLKLANLNSSIFSDINQRIVSEQHNDGGWIDCEDTSWNIFSLDSSNKYFEIRRRAIDWLTNERIAAKGWGFCHRDYPNIPITSQVLLAVPELRKQEIFSWLEKEWNKDLNAPVNLNYKGAWYLLACNSQCEFHITENTKTGTINYLISQQREDGGWGPWKNHPAPSDTFITGIAVAALSEFYLKNKSGRLEKSLKKSIEWFVSNQLENGSFPTHFIEEGSAWCYLGWKKALTSLNE